MKLWILEDEPRALQRLERMIGEIRSDAEVVERFAAVQDALSVFSKGAFPDVIVSDIQLADGLSFELFRVAPPTCPVLFTTAYDQYALEAFRTNGVAYLLKPFTAEELSHALDKAQRLGTSESRTGIDRIEALLTRTAPSYRSRFMVKAGDRIRSVNVQEVAALFSEDKHTLLRVGEREYVLDAPLDALQTELDPKQFFRISRKYLIHHAFIREVVAWSNSRLKVYVVDWNREDLIVSRERTPAFRLWLDS